MSFLRKCAYFLYPFSIAFIVAFSWTIKSAHAGTIRRMVLSRDHSNLITLAPTRSTAISFLSKPEKAVPAPGANLQVDFLGRDVIVAPLGRTLGNLIIYTKSERYVLNFKMGTDAHYDDVVETSFGSSLKRPIQLSEDTYNTEMVVLEAHEKSGRSRLILFQEVPVSIGKQNKRIESEELFDALEEFTSIHCEGCTVQKESPSLRIQCIQPINTLACTSKGSTLRIRRVSQ